VSISAIIGGSPLPDVWGFGGVGGLGAAATSGISTTTGGSFGDALSNAISSLEGTEATATTSSEQLATGQLSDPTQAITAVENASLAMDFASQIRNQIDTAATTLFQTQM
jgi:flagellar hook-basal body complex protein FliE